MAYEKHGFTFSLNADSDMSDKQYTAVKVTTDFSCDTATGTDTIVGIVHNNPKADMPASICSTGISKVKVADGKKITAGKGVAFTNGEASGDGTYGVALETVTGPAIGTLLLNTQTIVKSV